MKRDMLMDPSRIETLLALGVGLGFAGATFEGFFLVSQHQASFRLLFGRGALGLLAAPLLFVAGPFILLRNCLRGRRIEKTQAGYILLGTVIALAWSVVSGRVLLALIDMMATTLL